MSYNNFTSKIIIQKSLIICGIISVILYPIMDIIAGFMYSGYSFNQQAVSELFAIDAPTAWIVVPIFTISSTLLLLMGYGVFIISEKSNLLKAIAIMIILNAINCIILWNLFPMHMRGVQPDFTDKMHTILAINPFVLITIILGSIVFRNWFRYYSFITILLLFIPAFLSISNVPLFIANQPTPWMGYYERIAQYSHLTWHAIFAGMLIKFKI